jgi:hypothetical protein
MSQTNAQITAPVRIPCHTDGTPDDRVWISKVKGCKYRGVNYLELRAGDRRLEAGEEPPLGTHMVTPRRGYTHHGIYVGLGKVVQYAGLAGGLRRGPVEEVVLPQFAQGYPIWVRLEESPWFDGDEVIHRARSRVGEDRYHLLTNNCEHFCEWCVRGEHRSYQVDEWVLRTLRALQLTIDLVAKVLNVRNLRGA